MSQIQEIRIQLEGVSTALKTKRFRVPAYQRSFAWEKENVEALLNDVNDAIKNKETEYFLGSIVVTGPIEHRYEVVDGQQRLTTVSLLIASIKDIFKSKNDLVTVNSVETEFLASTDRKSKEKEPKLILNEDDNELYQELIESTSLVQPDRFSKQSNLRLIEATSFINEYLQKQCAASPDPEEMLHNWLDYLESNLKLIVVIASDDSNAFVIFETLNDRGLELAISDLLKNYLFHKSGEKLVETKNRWIAMVSILESASDDPLVVTFLRHVAMSKYGLVREKDLFGVIKKKVTSKNLALKFSSELRDKAKVYSALINTEHEYWNEYDPKVRGYVSALNLLGMTQIRPLLLAILEFFDKTQVKLVFQKLEAVAVRFQIVGGIGGGSLERIYSETAKQISGGEITKAAQVVSGFTTLPNDAAFEQAFSVATVSKLKLARYYLRRLEEGVASKDGEFVPDSDTTRVNLEHVLPLTLTEEWERIWVGEDAKAFQRRLGNMALMSAKGNSKAGNQLFSGKKPAYEKSGFVFTKLLANYAQWTKAEIEQRQKDMAKAASKAWSVK